ncbi:MAG: hypothetical protein COA44_07295 [Arcobacter sp.]|nr:MAG: hypothetical protein COA44_07295 [Arcobacter sp.]
MLKAYLVFIVLVSSSWSYSFFDSEKSIDKRHLDLIHKIKDVVINTQKTRGLTNNYMNGNVVAQLLVYGQRKEMIKNFADINKGFKRLELEEIFYKKSSSLIQNSKSLNQIAFKTNSAEVFTQYSDLIEKWMELNENIIVQRFKTNEKVYSQLILLNNVLLSLTENIGKMRGMGSGIVARGFCKENETLQMKGFANEVQRYKMLLQYHMVGKEYKGLSKNDMIKIEISLEAYASLTLEKVISKKDISLNTNEYFNQGTRAISDVLRVYMAVAASLN